MSGEEWKVIPHFAFYEVSSWGRMRRSVGKRNWPAGRMLKPSDCHGYLYVRLSEEGKSYLRTVHSLVAEAFWGPCPGGYCIHHKDGDRSNNNAENLKYMKVCQHAEEHSNLSVDDVARIKELHASGMSSCKIAKAYHTSASNIRAINGGTTWKRVGCDLPKTNIKPGPSKLNRSQIDEIKKLREGGMKQSEIAKMFNVHPSTISLIVRELRWQRD